TVYVKPYVGFTKLDIVGVVVQAPARTRATRSCPSSPPRRSRTPTPTVTVTVQPNGDLVDGSGKVVGNINEQPGGGDAAGDAAGNQQGNAQQPDDQGQG
ncbi:rod shape-determining protein MreC, partial [Streptomyces sp. Ncost-T6T-2b]